MQRVTAVISLAIAQMVGSAASVSAQADAGAGRGATHRLATHHAARHARHLTVRRRGSAPSATTRDFDAVPPDPLVVGFFRGVDGALDAPLDLDLPFGPRVFRDF